MIHQPKVELQNRERERERESNHFSGENVRENNKKFILKKKIRRKRI